MSVPDSTIYVLSPSRDGDLSPYLASWRWLGDLCAFHSWFSEEVAWIRSLGVARDSSSPQVSVFDCRSSGVLWWMLLQGMVRFSWTLQPY